MQKIIVYVLSSFKRKSEVRKEKCRFCIVKRKEYFRVFLLSVEYGIPRLSA